jgi:malate dehydrogenase (oxaloacetate-decarboxylating)
MDERERALRAHLAKGGKIEVIGSVPVDTKAQLSEYYTPGVAHVSLAIKADKTKAYDYTFKGRSAAIISDGTRVLGLGDIGPEAAMPVMEGKALLLKKFGGVDGVPICLATKDEAEIICIVKALAPTFGVINIEDIETPKCLNIVEKLRKELGIPVFHDDRNGFAVVTLAALTNALRLAGKRIGEAKIVVNGAGAAGMGIAELLVFAGARSVCLADTSGALYGGRKANMNLWKEKIAAVTNKDGRKGSLEDIARGADVLIGASARGAFTPEMVRSMAKKPIVFALANPYPEIDYGEALDAGAFIAATGRSDRPNQVNNLLAFPGIMRGLIEARAKNVDNKMLIMAAEAIARFTTNLSKEHIIPDPMDKETMLGLAPRVAGAVVRAANESRLAGVDRNPSDAEREVEESIRRYLKIERFVSKIASDEQAVL